MPILSRSFTERDPIKVGIAGVLAVAVLGFAIFNAGSVIRSFSSSSYTAMVSDAGNLKVGDDVRIAGVPVGTVNSISIKDDAVAVGFSMSDTGNLGAETGASIKSATVLGTKFLAVLPAGTGTLQAGATIPLPRTQAPYDIAQALGDFTRLSTQLDKTTLADSMNTLADTFADTPPELRSALDGLRRLSDTIASRDAALRALLSNSQAVTGLLAQRSGRVVTLLTDGNLLLDELNKRRDVIRSLLENVTATIDQLNGLVADNQKQLGPALDQLRQVLDMLNRQNANIAASIQGVNVYLGSLAEAIGGGPWFFALVPNLVPTNLAPVIPTLLGKGK
jgi:phospholipid/cholesterol/gamma-HCH transport system substrate-binding protein